MKKKGLTLGLAYFGTFLVWLPIAAPVIFSLIRFFQSRHFLFDFLMPAELFHAVLLGGILQLIAACLSHMESKLIAWGLGISVAMLVAGQGFAVVTGMASGAVEPQAWMWALVLFTLAVYTAAVVAIGVGGIRLIKALQKS